MIKGMTSTYRSANGVALCGLPFVHGQNQPHANVDMPSYRPADGIALQRDPVIAVPAAFQAHQSAVTIKVMTSTYRPANEIAS